MKTSGLVLAVLTVLILWINQGETKALNAWNENYPNDFFDPYDQPPQRRERNRKRDRGGHNDNGPFARDDRHDNRVPQYEPIKEQDKASHNEVGQGYYPQWDAKIAQEEAEWDARVQEKLKLPRPGQKLNDDWEWQASKEEASGSEGIDSDDEDDGDDDADLRFEVEQFEQDQKRKDRIKYELDDVEWEKEKLTKRLNRVSDRLEEEKQMITFFGKKARGMKPQKYY